MSHPRNQGFTLPEVLATLVIVGIVLPVALQGITVSVRAAGNARHQLEAGQLAQQKMAELVLEKNNGSLAGSGDFGEEWPLYRWTSETSTAPVNTSATLEQLDVTVTWTAQGQERNVTLTTFVYADIANAPAETAGSAGGS